MRRYTVPFLPFLLPLSTGAPTLSSTTVKASTGYYTGQINQNYSNVREFLNVPYGETTAGKNRFMPPVAVPMSDRHFDGTQYAKACPQYVSAIPSIWSEQISQYLQYWAPPNNTAGESAVFATEDCLSLAIWTPANATAWSNLPVALFWTGGGFCWIVASHTSIILDNTSNLPPYMVLTSYLQQLPGKWISLSQSHIVVTINYRMNILGFPNAAGVYEQNLGLLDQRKSLEWVRDNIRYFGGDPSRVMIWGQSAGAQSVDFHNYAFYEDLIAHAFFAESGSCLAFGSGDDLTHSNFTFVAKYLGCDYPSNAKKELECMQGLDYHDIINFMGRYTDNGTEPAIHFEPVADERRVFSNYTARYQSGMVTKAPMIYSSVANEGGSLSPYSIGHVERGPNQTAANVITEEVLCGAANSSILRTTDDLVTYRYQYAGNWTNQDPLPWMGAFHSSDLVTLFGSYETGEGPVTQPLEGETSAKMGELLLSFMEDPYNGPPSMGWPQFDPTAKNGGTMLRFGADGKVMQEVGANKVQAVCFGKGPYNPFP